MRMKILTAVAVLALALVAAHRILAPLPVGAADVGPQMASIGPLTFGPDGVLFAADTQARRSTRSSSAPGQRRRAGRQGVDAIDQKIAALLGTDAEEIAITDLAVHPTHAATPTSP